MKSWYEWDKDVLHVDFGGGNVSAFTRDFLEDSAFVYKGKDAFRYMQYKIPPNKTNTWTVNAGDLVNSCLPPATATQMDEQLNNMFKEAKEKAERSVRAIEETKMWFSKPNTTAPSTPKNMKRLTTYNDWTILLENDKLVAIDSRGNTVRAVGSLISAGGKAWMWKDGRLYSGELTQLLTEEQEKAQAKQEAINKIRAKYNKQLDRISVKDDKLNALRDKIYTQRDEELRSL